MVSYHSEHAPSEGVACDKLKFEDALTYLKQVKYQFVDQPAVYNEFLDIMKAFKQQTIDTVEVIENVTRLFHGHTALILGMNAFLPPGYKIEVQDDINGVGMTTEYRTPADSIFSDYNNSNSNNHETRGARKPVEFSEAVNYVKKVESRFSENVPAYNRFLYILSTYEKHQYTIKQVCDQVEELFRGHEDLIIEFTHFLPKAY